MITLIFRLCLVLPILLIGTTCFLLLNSDWANPYLSKICQHSEDIAHITSGYAFTLAGFIASVFTFASSFIGNSYLRYHTKNGCFGDLLFATILTLVSLFSVFVVSIICIAYPRPVIVSLLLSLTTMSFVAFAASTYATYRLAQNCSTAND